MKFLEKLMNQIVKFVSNINIFMKHMPIFIIRRIEISRLISHTECLATN